MVSFRYARAIEPRKTTKQDLKAAAIHLLARGGPQAASVRSITKRAGVTEAALYRHYRNKDALYYEACAEVVLRMIEEKRRLIARKAPAAARLRDWVRLTYEFFDSNADAFACVFLRDDGPDIKVQSVDGQQSGMFQTLYLDGVRAGEFLPMDEHLATALFSGAMLQIPRLIDKGVLPGPAMNFADLVADRVLWMLRPEHDLS